MDTTTTTDKGQEQFLADLESRVQDPGGGRWGLLELMGHRQIFGYQDEVQMAGGSFVRMQHPQPDGTWINQGEFGAAAIYGFTTLPKRLALHGIPWVATKAREIQREWMLQQRALPAPEKPPVMDAALPAEETCTSCGNPKHAGLCDTEICAECGDPLCMGNCEGE
jgi:hypothetical protein